MYDQLHLNSCSANALAAALRFDEIAESRPGVASPSRLFIYYNERSLAGVVAHDVPVPLREGYRAVAKYGACAESSWPYDPRRFRRTPTSACYRAARRHVAIEYYRIRRAITQMRACLAERHPFVFGMAVHRSMFSREVKKSGIVPVPTRRDRSVGGHAVLAVGYLAAKRLFIIRNSWGAGWGDRGYGYVPDAFMTSTALSWDFWTLRRVS